MEEFKSVTLRISLDIYNRIDRLAPHKKWGRHDVQEFWTQIFLDGLEHPRFMKLEHRRITKRLEIEKTMLQHELSAAQKQLQQEPQKEVPASVLEEIARNVEILEDSVGKSSGSAQPSSAAKAAENPPTAAAPSSPDERTSGPEPTPASRGDGTSSVH